MTATHESVTVGGFDIKGLIAEMRAAGRDDWADRVEALRTDYGHATRDVAGIFHVDVMDEVRARIAADDKGYGAPLTTLTGALVDLVGTNTLGKSLKPRKTT